MNIEAANVFVCILLSVGFFTLVLPLAVVLVKLRKIAKSQPETALILAGLVILTGTLFAIYIVGLGSVAFGGYL